MTTTTIPRCPDCTFSEQGYVTKQCPQATKLWKRRRSHQYFHHVFGDEHPRGLRWDPEVKS